MKKQLLFLFAMVMVPLMLTAQTNISGNIENNATFTAASSPYIVTGNLNVNAGVTLTVEPGVEVRVNNGLYIQVFGTMNATGATFTSNTGTTPGAWQGIYVSYHYSSEVGAVNLDNCIVEYAQSLFVRKGSLVLSGGTMIRDLSSYGLDIYTEGDVDISNTTVQNCTYPVYFRSFQGNGSWTVGDGVILTGNATDYVYIDFQDVNSEFRLADAGIPYYYDSEFRVTETGTLVIDPGVQMLGNTNAFITVYGKLKANGTVADSVLFANEPSAAYWRGLNFYDAAIDSACILSYARFSGANYVSSNYRPYEISSCAVEISGSSPQFMNCTFTDNRYNLVVQGSSMPEFTDCTFDASNRVAKDVFNINIDLNAEPVFTDCDIDFNNSEGRAIGIIGATVIGDSRLEHRSFNGLDSISYVLFGNVIVHDTASLVIDPGIVIKCTDNNYYFMANGALTGIGTEDTPIVFTHINDDNYGNPADTHNDGTTSISNSSSGRIILSGVPTSTIDHWKIHYAGLNSSSYAVYAYNGNIVRNTEISHRHRGVLFSHDAQVINTHFSDVTNYPLARRMNAGAPVLIGNTIENSGNMGIFVHDFLDGVYTISGLDIGENTNVAYIVSGNVTIPAAANVTIPPGTVFKFDGYYGKLSVSGGLFADGTPGNKVIFTSIFDNSASGNTNFNTGNDPIGNKWDGLEFFDASDDTFNQLDNTEVRYVRNSIRMTNCRVVLDSVLLNFSDGHALGIFGSADPQVTNCTFNNLGNAPVYMDMFANPTFSGNTVSNVARMGITIRGGTISGTVPVRSFAGVDNITYLITETIRVDDELNIPAGLTFKGVGSAYFDIYGTFNVQGTDIAPVVFTTLQDDAYGNPRDTELNGSGSISKQGNRIVFRNLSDDNSVIDHAIFRYSYDYAIYMESASPVITNTTMYNTNRTGLYLVGSSAPTVNNCVFDDLTYPVITSLMTFPGSYSGNVLSGSTAKAIAIIDDETLTQNYTLGKRSFAGIANIPYLFNRYTVGTSAVLTIEPGVILKFIGSGYMNIRNGLIANGGSTPDSTIIFTADRDDFYGGDTYSDGDANLPNRQYWWGIHFAGESIDGSSLLNNCIIKNASRYYSSGTSIYNRGGVTMDNASPTIRNTLFESSHRAIIARNTSLPVIENCDFVDVDPTYGYAVWNETGVVTITAENCWWNDPTGPYHPTLNPDGLGERVSDNVDFDPWISQSSKPIMGDVSLNGEVMPYDASLVLQHTVGNVTLEPKQLEVADVSGNDEVTSFDASLILQYTIGLITSFDQSVKKSAGLSTGVEVVAPERMEVSPNTSFEVPVAITTPMGVKSLDLRIKLNGAHLGFRSISSNGLPPEIMVAHGYSASTGILNVALTSAYDLDLDGELLKLTFITSEQENAAAPGSISLERLLANETSIGEGLFEVQVETVTQTTGTDLGPGLSEVKVYSVDGRIVADLNLSDAQDRLVVSVFDITGRKTNSMIIASPGTGRHQFTFDAEADGSKPDFKVYVVAIEGNGFVVTRKLVVR
jgi:parallel beta-helix repeat protein